MLGRDPMTLSDCRRSAPGAQVAVMGGNLDRQSACRYRARTAVLLAAGGKQALASLTSLRLAGHASIVAARRFHAAAQIACCKRS
jgi:hypothetical protein